MATRKVRVKKLNVKTLLPVLREDEIDASEYESLTNETQIATGVEQAEENEYHLQAVLQTSGTSADKEIPVPPPQESALNYDELYPVKFAEPSNYIRFSQTVEECIGCQYDMTEDDETFLKAYNQDRAAGSAQLSEDDFECIMEIFEETAAVQAPFAAVDNTVVPYDLMVQGLSGLDSPIVMAHAKAIYDYWKRERQAKKGPLHPTLKFETHQDSDEMDPFVCFRRREVRQTRKTRQRDVQSADKLKRLRRELEEGRELILLAYKREQLKRDLLHIDQSVFETRARIKGTKIRLGIKTDDDDLFTTKPQRKKPAEVPQIQRPPAGPLRAPARPDGRSNDPDLVLLADQQAERENELRLDVEIKIENHRKWNLNFVDVTRDPVETRTSRPKTGYRPVKVQYLMTPPNSASASVDDLDEPEPMDLDSKEPAAAAGRERTAAVPTAAPTPPMAVHFRGLLEDDVEYSPQPKEYRRRYGRLNRLWVDRRDIKPLKGPPPDSSSFPSPFAPNSDRWKYDGDTEDEDDDQAVYEVDPYDLRALKFRATIPLSSVGASRQAVNGVALTNGIAPAGRVALPSSSVAAGGGIVPVAVGTQQRQNDV